MEEERIKVWQMGMYNYTDIGLDKPVMYKENFLKQIASDTQSVDVTDEHSNSILGSLSNFKYENGVLYANKPSDIDITGNGFSPVFDCDLVDMGDYYEPRNFTMTSVGLTKNPRSNILYNSITEEMDKVSDELRAMLDRKEETIAEQREEIGILKKQMEELREKSKSSDETLNEFKALQKQFDELKANAETYKADSDRLREQEAKAKEKLIKEIVGDDTKGMEMFQKFSVEELEHMKNTKIVTEPIKAVGSQSVDTITDGDADDIPQEDQVDEYSQEYFEKWERENTHW
jgi:hypothetical protein